MDREPDPGSIAGILAMLGEDLLEIRAEDGVEIPAITLSGAETSLGRPVGNELLYLRDRDVLEQKNHSGGVYFFLGEENIQDAERHLKKLYREHDADLERMADEAVLEFVDWQTDAEWDEPLKDLGHDLEYAISYDNPGRLCAALSLFGSAVENGMERPEYPVRKVNSFADNSTGIIDLSRELELLEGMGYVEKHLQGDEHRYRLVDDPEIREDARQIFTHVDNAYGGHPIGIARSYETADQQQLEEAGVKLVQKPRNIV